MSSTALGGYEGGPYYLSFGYINSKNGSLTFDPKKLEKQFDVKPETVRAFTNNYSTSNSNIPIKH